MTEHNAPAAISALRNELKAFVDRWAAVTAFYEVPRFSIPKAVWDAGQTALEKAGYHPLTASENQAAAAFAPVLRDHLRRSWPWICNAAADEMDDITLWREYNTLPRLWFAERDAEIRPVVAGKVAGLFLNVFAPLASKTVKAFGREPWPVEPPDPPQIPEEVHPDDLAGVVFGIASNNTLEAGKLCLLWGAMTHDPRAFQRPDYWPRKVIAWAGRLIINVGDGNVLRTMGEPIEWALDAFDHLAAERRDAASSKSVGVSPETQNSNGIEAAPSGFLGATELAVALGVHPSRREAFIMQLSRKRKTLGDESYITPQNRTPNSPEFLYRADSPQLRKLAARYRDPKSA